MAIQEKPKVHEESKLRHDEHRNETKQFKIEDKVLLAEKDPRIATFEHNTNEVTPLTVLNIFPHGTVKVTHTEFRTFKSYRPATFAATLADLSDQFTHFEQHYEKSHSRLDLGSRSWMDRFD
ncbi:hypothetical protein GOBAR_AA12571 [Gossypium barbadense]|uniref:Uncharacterized protein n=1 Tax=Gossypium barbadense TaxID=3634 RepID=A0A2P5XXK7_GOSBA|nr:hypothetical protein GOBAR_AA12571 [Gossypium barbadense]